ncbi:hypothetical protein QRX60_47060 [Amycolatopsis mongoliensis]|uniref:Uncharacterized protein n=1 Tax=Amycolatopsis mongoliensis TaxID=715475 RepID=A0A9Y2JMZ0_9PSEU|nr:hypothetical protein [Amycolatopsis sp. 4-36]WIY01505.1 hypothetical protein QRX60_47060 [Amycolatopsis sp. 4-36]
MSFDLAGWSAPEDVAAEEAVREHERSAADAVRSPPASRGDPVPLLSACDGSRVEHPDAAAIEAAVGRLSPRNWFLVLDRGDHYVQVSLGERAATRPGWYALEHRDGLPDRHFRAEVAERAGIVRALIGFAAGEDAWRQAFDWQHLKF